MIINHPLLGPRDAEEFVHLGDASLLVRPDWQAGDATQVQDKFHDYVYLRDNPAGEYRELWYHEHGDRSYLVVTRCTISHDISRVELARDVAQRLNKNLKNNTKKIKTKTAVKIKSATKATASVKIKSATKATASVKPKSNIKAKT